MSKGLVSSSSATRPHCFEQEAQEERSVVVILSDPVNIADTNALTQSLQQLQFRTAFIGADAIASLRSAPEPNRPCWWLKGEFDDLRRPDAVISFGDESLRLLKPALLHLKASVHVAEAAQAFIKLFESLAQSMCCDSNLPKDEALMPDHHALLIETGPPGDYSTATSGLGHQPGLRVIRVNSAYWNHPYADPLIIELARRHLEMWV